MRWCATAPRTHSNTSSHMYMEPKIDSSETCHYSNKSPMETISVFQPASRWGAEVSIIPPLMKSTSTNEENRVYMMGRLHELNRKCMCMWTPTSWSGKQEVHILCELSVLLGSLSRFWMFNGAKHHFTFRSTSLRWFHTYRLSKFMRTFSVQLLLFIYHTRSKLGPTIHFLTPMRVW